MKNRLSALCSLAIVSTVAWWGTIGYGDKKNVPAWTPIAPGILRSPGYPAGYALVDGARALLIDAPHSGQGLEAHGINNIEGVLLTHYHRGSCAAVGDFLKQGIKVQAPKAAAEWLTPKGVQKYWRESLPLRNSRTAYLIVPEGFAGIDYALEDSQTMAWRGWTIQMIATPGHARAHLAFAVRKDKTQEPIVFAGGLLAAPKKLWAPYTTDWDHWTNAGLVPTAQSLRKLIDLKPSLILPAHGPPIDRDPRLALEATLEAVEDLSFLKSFERFTKQRLGNAPQYRFLAKEQAESNGSKPWSQVSNHLFLTGNTYVLTSKDNACLMFDPWDKRSADQVAKLQKDQKLGKLEVVMFSHAHYDHYDGIYHLPERNKLEVWMLDKAAIPVADPFLLRAPFLDARPVKIDRLPKDGDTLTWREYRFRFHHFPGQSEFTMGVETVIDGKKCFFTADNFFHQDQFSGSGGWMGLNRSWPLPYAASAQKVLDAAPDWVLAEHGGPFEFSAEDFRRRVQWGQVSGKSADVLCLSGNHRSDWDPHRVHIEPLVQKAKPGDTVKGTLVAYNPMPQPEKLMVVLAGRRLTPDQTWDLEVGAGATVRPHFSLKLANNLQPGRHVFPLRISGNDPSDAFMVIDVE